MDTKFLKIARENKDEFDYFLKKIFPIVMLWEGGGKLHNVKGDTGGQTIWGIAYNKNKQYFDSLSDHANTTEEEAGAFAFVEYYLPLKPNLLPIKTKLYAFDISYNMGVNRSKKYIQECIGVVADGIIGEQTESKMKDLKVDCLHKLRINFYNNLAINPINKKFLKGWLNRATDIYNRSK